MAFPMVAGRVVQACLVAVSTFLVAGAAFAETDGPPEAPDRLSVPAPMLGDRGTYDLTVVGEPDWVGLPFTGQPFRFLDFEWRRGGVLLGGDGALHATEHLRIQGLAYRQPSGPTAEDGRGAWEPVQHLFHYEAGSGDRLAMESPLAQPDGGALAWRAAQQVDEEGDALVRIFVAGPAVDGLLVHPPQGGPWREGLSFPVAFELLGVGLVRGEAVVESIGASHGRLLAEVPVKVREAQGALLDGSPSDVTLWFADGIPYPAMLRWRTPDGEVTMDLVGFERGREARASPAPPIGPLPPLARATRPPWTLDDADVPMPFPLSAAFQQARDDPEFDGLRRFLGRNPDAYVSGAFEVVNGWSLFVTGAAETYNLTVVRRIEASVSPLAESPYTGSIGPRLPSVPPPPSVPRELPTLASLLDLWLDHTGGDGVEDRSVEWEFSVLCAGLLPSDEGGTDCSRAVLVYTVGRHAAPISRVGLSLDPAGVSEERDYSWSFIEGAVSAGAEEVLAYRRSIDSRQATFGAAEEGQAGQPPSAGFEASTVPPMAAWRPSPQQAAGAGAFAVAAGVLYLLWPALKGGAAGLFSRVGEPALLEHPYRRWLLHLVEAQPGIHFNGLLRTAGMGNGTLVHHLDLLVRGGKVRKVTSGGYACYFPASHAPDPTVVALKSAGAQKVLQAVRATPGLSNREVAQRTGLDPSTVHYHIQKLASNGLVRVRRRGRMVRLEVHGKDAGP